MTTHTIAEYMDTASLHLLGSVAGRYFLIVDKAANDPPTMAALCVYADLELGVLYPPQPLQRLLKWVGVHVVEPMPADAALLARLLKLPWLTPEQNGAVRLMWRELASSMNHTDTAQDAQDRA